MKKIDEMDRNIQLRSKEIGYTVMILILAIWTFYNCWQTLANGAKYNPLPGLIVCFSVSVQAISQNVIKQKMIDGDEEYHEPNKVIWLIFAIIVISTIVLSLGTYFLLKA